MVDKYSIEVEQEVQEVVEETPLISVIIPTVGRPSLWRAVLSALEQELPAGSLEVIVVNDTGSRLDAGATLPDDQRVTVVTTNRRRQSVARNVGAATARGRYVLFLDDDDWLAPGGLGALYTIARETCDAPVIYGGVAYVDETGRQLGSLNLGVSGNCASHMLAAALIPLGSALIRLDTFFGVGGINQTLTIGEEIDLFRRLSMVVDFHNTPSTVLTALRGQGYATSLDYDPAVALLRASREEVLDQRHAFFRLIQSACDPYWRGRNVKAYAASVLWNVKARRLMRVLSRVAGVVFSVLATGTALFHPDFWQALGDSQVPATQQRALEKHSRESKNELGAFEIG